LDILEETYLELKNLGLTKSQLDYSTKWLNKSQRYFSMHKATRRNPSVDTLGRLAANLKQRHELYRTNKIGELRTKSDLIYPTGRKIWAAFY